MEVAADCLNNRRPNPNLLWRSRPCLLYLRAAEPPKVTREQSGSKNLEESSFARMERSTLTTWKKSPSRIAETKHLDAASGASSSAANPFSCFCPSMARVTMLALARPSLGGPSVSTPLACGPCSVEACSNIFLPLLEPPWAGSCRPSSPILCHDRTRSYSPEYSRSA